MTACASVQHASSGHSRGDDAIVIGMGREPHSLNPLLEQGDVAGLVGKLLFTFLVNVDERGNLISEAAREVPTAQNGGVSKDGLRVVYHLKPGIRWQDGAPLTARDCVFTYRAIMNPRNNIPVHGGYDAIESVRAPDDRTVVVTLKQPYAPITGTFLAAVYNYPIMPAHVLEHYADLNAIPFNARPVGSGPFRVTDWQRGDHLTMSRSKTFFRGRPNLERVTIRFIPQYETIINELKTGELDASFSMSPQLYRRLLTIPGLAVTLTPVSAVVAFFLNATSGPTADVRVRRAIAQAIDVPSLVRNATDGVYRSNDAMRGLFGWAYTHVPELPYDAQAAAQTLDNAGWKLGPDGIRYKNGERLSLAIITENDDPAIWTTSTEQMLRQIGIDTAIKSFTAAQYSAPAAQGGPVFGLRYGAALFIFGSTGDADTAPFFSCDQRPPNGFNLSGFCNPTLDAAERDGETHFDRGRRIRDARVVEALLHTEVPLIVLAQTRRLNAYTKRLRGFTPSTASPYWQVWNWSLQGR